MSPQDLQQLRKMEDAGTQGVQALEATGAAFQDVSEAELEEEIAKALAEVRAEIRAELQQRQESVAKPS